MDCAGAIPINNDVASAMMTMQLRFVFIGIDTMARNEVSKGLLSPVASGMDGVRRVSECRATMCEPKRVLRSILVFDRWAGKPGSCEQPLQGRCLVNEDFEFSATIDGNISVTPSRRTMACRKTDRALNTHWLHPSPTGAQQAAPTTFHCIEFGPLPASQGTDWRAHSWPRQCGPCSASRRRHCNLLGNGARERMRNHT